MSVIGRNQLERQFSQATTARRGLMAPHDRPLYWPGDNEGWPYALALLEVTLRDSEAAQKDYARLVELWALPGLQRLKDDALSHAPETKAMSKALIAALERKDKSGVAWPDRDDAYQRYKDNADFNQLVDAVVRFILQHYNRPVDLEDERTKVVPGRGNETLVAATFMRSIVDFTEYDAARLLTYRDPKVEAVGGPWPSDRQGRELRHKVTGLFKTYGRLKAPGALLELAWQWRQSRVVYSGPTEFCRHLYKERDIYLDDRNVHRQIKPFDTMTGYPRGR